MPGIGTSVEGVKQNKGGREGVTGARYSDGYDHGNQNGYHRDRIWKGDGNETKRGRHKCQGDHPVWNSTCVITIAAEFQALSQSQCPDSSRKPKKRAHGDKNEHRMHKQSSWDRDSGSGIAAEEPFLPSHLDSNRKGEGRSRGASSEQV
ncbi:hypothetical protein F5J12DRAFT_784531 [Pisolithus orientalis]|uniref:uncharacterized protein n=1 Tax=Pisolithus orientalis TaxID=936130 RepID=UPI002225735C|nr:uncharacterized protein F5J12DRAFT_784531 [Pisolithus orientalis]KAI5999750.1 hypothetical protein F5J12DRAFT_784531 [Pisolithus orientalis]